MIELPRGYRAASRDDALELAERPMVKEDWKNPGTNWVLLLKKF